MPVTKNALIRYKVLDRCFANLGRKYFIEDLIEEVGKMLREIKMEESSISRRTIMADIQFMESPEGWNIDLVRGKVGKKVYYRYEDLSFSINNMPLNETEINHLKSAMDILSGFKGMPQFEWMQEMLPKLQQGYDIRAEKIIEFENNPDLKGLEHLGELYNAVYYKKVLSITYQDYKAERPYEVLLHPHFLKQYNNRWFLFGYCPNNQRYDWNLALDRIVSIREAKGRAVKSTIIWDEYFDDMIGVTRPVGAEVQDVVLHFTGVQGKYIESKPLHGSQRGKWIEKDNFEVRLSLIVNYELERLILGYADTVRVVKPKSLANAVAKKLEMGIGIYNQN